MIPKIYYYFIKTKYLKPLLTGDVEKLDQLHKTASSIGLNASTLSNNEKEAIEVGLLGEALTKEFRHVDNSILRTPFIMNSFIEDQLSWDKREEREEEETGGTLLHLSDSVQKIRDEILAGMDEEGRRKAIELGLV